jgi:hypothetical protein
LLSNSKLWKHSPVLNEEKVTDGNLINCKSKPIDILRTMNDHSSDSFNSPNVSIADECLSPSPMPKINTHHSLNIRIKGS